MHRPGRRVGRSARSRFVWGAVLLVVGAITLAKNLGIDIPREFWEYWPAIPLTLGAVQMLWPGTLSERMSGFWLVAVGIYGFVSQFELFGLHWGTSWPILIVALGIRIVMGGVFERDPPSSDGTLGNTSNSSHGGTRRE